MMLCLQHGTARILLSGTCPNPAKIMAGAGFGRICHKRLDAGPAGAGAEIRYIPILGVQPLSCPFWHCYLFHFHLSIDRTDISATLQHFCCL